jgi:DNA-binding beta-propeller fold protein YncE
MRWMLALAAALAAVACGGALPAAEPTAHAVAGQVYVQAAGEPSLWVVDAATGQVVRSMPAGVPSPDWRRLYRLSAGALDVLDPLTGRVVAAHPAPSWAQVVRTSADGGWLVFATTGPSDRFQVQDAAWASGPVDVALRGGFTFDGISADGRRLYLLERLGGDRYHVRMYDLVVGALAPYVIVDKQNISEDMSGTALASFATRTGEMQLTLYQRADGQGRAFVHALPIGQAAQWAYCVDLPGPSSGWAFAAAPDGRRFYAANPGDGRIVELDGQNVGPPDMRQRQVPAGGAGAPSLALSPDGATLYVGGGTGVVAVDARTLAVRAAGLAGQPVSALATAPDGGVVYAVSGSRLLRLDPRSLAEAGEVTLHGPLGAILRAT